MKEKIKKICIITITILMTMGNILPNMVVHAQELSNPERTSIIKEAEKHIGKPYVWGAVGPDLFDCSSYTQYVFKHSINFSLQRTAEQQRQQLISSGKEINKNDMSQWNPGDLMFFGNHDYRVLITGGVDIPKGNKENIIINSIARFHEMNCRDDADIKILEDVIYEGVNPSIHIFPAIIGVDRRIKPLWDLEIKIRKINIKQAYEISKADRYKKGRSTHIRKLRKISNYCARFV